MKYFLNPEALRTPFMLPCSVVDNHIKMAGAVQLKVLLYVFRHSAEEISAEGISAFLSVSSADVADSLRFWADAGVLCAEGETAVKSEEAKPAFKAVKAAAVKPTRAEVARRGNEDEKIAFLLREAEMKFGRALRQSEASTLVWLYDDEGMSPAVLLMLLEFAASENKLNVGFIERTALDWVESGVENPADAERKITEIYDNRSCWKQVERAFGISDRMPSATEQKYSVLWIKEWKISRELLREAYNRCVDSTGKMQMKYIASIIENWHKSGISDVAEIKDNKPKSYAAYDESAFDDILSAIDKG